MPAQPRWLADLPKIRRTITAMTATPFLDRLAIERLFGVKSRQANYLMRSLGGYRIGPASVVDRDQLLHQLERMATPRGVSSAATERKARVIERLDALAREARPRRILAPPPRRPSDPLPPGIRLSAPGEIAIRFASPEELLGLILALAQSASTDFAAFAVSLIDSPTRNCVCTDAATEAGLETSPTEEP